MNTDARFKLSQASRICLMALSFATLMVGCAADSATPQTRASEANQMRSLSTGSARTACVNARDATDKQPVSAYISALEALAEAGEACAQYGLGMLYKTGFGEIEADADRAFHYLLLAADQHLEEALQEPLYLARIGL
jgi:TPR repeat protein